MGIKIELTDDKIIEPSGGIAMFDLPGREFPGNEDVLFDAGAGDGKVFNWKLLENVKRPYFLAGGLDPENVRDAVERLRPFGVDVSRFRS